MAQKTSTFETGHEEMIHDTQMDYYGRRLATASSDRTIKIFEVNGDKQTQIAHLRGHDGPVWAVAWSHPKWGPLLASCGYDGRVLLWKEAAGVWNKIFEDASHEASGGVNSLSWAPHTLGLILVAGAADGTVSIYEYRDNNTWERKVIAAHRGACTAVSWAPDMKTGSLLSAAETKSSGGGAPPPTSGAAGGAAAGVSGAPLAEVKAVATKRFVTSGCDNRIRIWRFVDNENKWAEQKSVWQIGDVAQHNDWVRDVAWAPSIGLPSSTIASASEDKTVVIWSEDAAGMWKKAKTLKFDHKVWRVSWSTMGNVLAVSQGDNRISLWKESIDGDWKNLASARDAGTSAPPAIIAPPAKK